VQGEIVKYRKYVLTFAGDPEAVAFLAGHVDKRWPSLEQARARGRAARLLLGVEYKVRSVVVPRPTAEGVKAL